MKVKIVGLNRRASQNKDTGEMRVFTDLYYVKYRPIKQTQNNKALGYETGHISTQLKTDDVEIDKVYDLEIEVKEFQGRAYKVLADIEPVKN